MVNLQTTLTCPACGLATVETMPTDRCVYFYECPHCHVVLKPKPGDCCVYCSYGDTRCPFVQDEVSCPDSKDSKDSQGR